MLDYQNEIFEIVVDYFDRFNGDTSDEIKNLCSAIKQNRMSYTYCQLKEAGRLSQMSAADTFVGTFRCVPKTDGSLSLVGSAKSPIVATRYFIFANDILLKDVKADARGNLDFNIPKSTLVKMGKGIRFVCSSDVGLLFGATGKWMELSYSNEQSKHDTFCAIPSGTFMSKKGVFVPYISENTDWQSLVLDGYTNASRIFEEEFSYKLFIFYGTLLGYIRNGDFIPHDDDFDAAYLSRETTPESVREEMIAIVRRLRELGIAVKVAPKNAPKLLHYPLTKGHFDIFPSWHDGEYFWAPNTTRISCDRGMISDIHSAKFKGVSVNLPIRAEEFLEKKYGPTWRNPDPGYRTQASSEIRNHLAKLAWSDGDIE